MSINLKNYVDRRGKLILKIFLILITVSQAFAQVKIMPLGDSITEGDLGDTGYRRSLYLQLVNAGYNINFVGSLNGGTPADFDRDHEGWGGWHAYMEVDSFYGSLWHYIPKFLADNPSNVILLHIGTNDIGTAPGAIFDTPQSLSDELKMILDRIDSIDNNITIFLAMIVNRSSPQLDSLAKKTSAFDSLLQLRADTLIGLGRKIVKVDMEHALSYPGDLVDGLHPDTSGYRKMADTWFNALQAYYQPVLATPSNGATDQPLNVTLNWSAPPAANGSSVYHLQVSTVSDFSSNIVFENSSISGTSIQPTGLQYGTQYFWRVKIPNFGWSAVWNFTTMPPLFAHINVFLQGPYSGGSMSTSLNTAGYIPLSQPYSAAPWSYAGSESVSAGFFASNPLIVDWVLVELRETATDTAVARRAAFLKSGGSIVDLDGTSDVNFSGTLPNDYYIVVKHRNHLAVMSVTAITPTLNTLTHNFTDAQNKAYGTNPMADFGDGKFGLIAGDANVSGGIYGEDYTAYQLTQGNEGYLLSDFNLSGGIYGEDYTIYQLNQGKETSVP